MLCYLLSLSFKTQRKLRTTLEYKFLYFAIIVELIHNIMNTDFNLITSATKLLQNLVIFYYATDRKERSIIRIVSSTLILVLTAKYCILYIFYFSP